jgi:hypothetical protein
VLQCIHEVIVAAWQQNSVNTQPMQWIATNQSNNFQRQKMAAPDWCMINIYLVLTRNRNSISMG